MPHGPFLEKIESYGVRGVAQDLIRTYLSGRTQQVHVNGETSGFRHTTAGVPQGSILGGVLFIVYINDLPSQLDAIPIIYADDTTLLTAARTVEEVQVKAKQHMEQAKQWFQQNDLNLQEQKTEKLSIEMDRWKETDQPVKFLGITIDARLTWNSHIQNLEQTLNRATYAIRKVHKTAGIRAARVAYMALFHSRMSYAIETWGHSSHTRAILITQKRAVRSITMETQMTHAKPLFICNKILTVHAVYILKCTTNIHKASNSMERHADTHSYNTRNRNILQIDFHRLATTSYRALQIHLYNLLPEEWKTKNMNGFRRTIRDHLIKTAPYNIDEFIQGLPQIPRRDTETL